jgi:hypothetical protein
MNQYSQKQVNYLKLGGVLVLFAIFVIPFLSFAGNKKDIYVDDSASSSNENGSASHPFNTIKEALKNAEKSDKKVEIHVSNGVYHENIDVPSNTKIFGENKDKTIIEGDNDEPAVKLNHKTEINKVTITGGAYGVVVDNNDRASIVKCVIKDNDKDGIKIKSANVEDKYLVSITETEIYDNGRSGIYSEKRKLSIIDNFIYGNDGDGIDIVGGSSAWIAENKMKENDKSGMKLTLDGASIWTKNNTYYENKREGLEVNTYGVSGRIDINKSKFYKNKHYGVAKVNRNSSPSSVWRGLTIQADVVFWENELGNIIGK